MTASVNLGEEPRTGRLLRIFLGEGDRIDGRPAFRVVVETARELGLAGATVLHGSMGYGANSVIHRPELWRVSHDLPVVIEVVDEEARVSALIERLEGMLGGGGLITVESVRVLRYQAAAR
jgi:uncharacterized protein